MLLLRLLSSLVFVEEKRRLIEVFPERVKTLWNEWELRVMVLISLALQISLLHFGNCRKYNVRTRIRIFLWCAYLMADWVATVALGVLSNMQGNFCSCGGGNDNPADDDLTAFWAPFLLLHLGGPDTITAYALADNELWLRHLLGLIVQTSVAIYIIVVTWNGTWLSFLAIPMLLAGIIKYGERSWVLRLANREQFRDSMLTPPDPGPNYAKFMEEFSLKQAEGFHVMAAEVIETPVRADDPHGDDGASKNPMLKAHTLFQTFKRLFVDLILSFHDRDKSQSYFQTVESKTAFEVIEVELGFAYDVFYTKAPIIYTLWGFIFRFITFFFTVLAFMFFLIGEKHKHCQINLAITYILLVGAILLEIYAFTLLLSSDWMNIWLRKHPNTPLSRAISCFQLSNKQRWSNSVAQYNLLSFCLQDRPVVCPRILRLLPMYSTLEKRQYKTHGKISGNLKGLIFDHFKEKLKRHRDFSIKEENDIDLTALCTCRGRLVLEQFSHTELDWTTGVEFDQSILIWHIATDICYYNEDGGNQGTINSNREESKHISDYMLYLLVMCPFMLPIGIGMIRFRDTCAEAKEFFRERSPTSGKHKACEMLLQVSTKVLPIKVKGDRSKSVLFDACRLASSMQKIEDSEERWKIVSNVWVEILGYAAGHCKGYYHAQQLKNGGELLTHVWLLMAHLGITEQFQISRGHARSKLIVC